MKLLKLLALVLVLIGFTAPVWVTLIASFSSDRFFRIDEGQISLRWYEEFFSDRRWFSGFQNSVLIALAAAVGSTVMGLCSALGVSGATSRWRGIVTTLLLLPAIIPPTAWAIGLLNFATRRDWHDSYGLLVAVHTLVALPATYIILRSARERIDPTLYLIARGFGATPWQLFRSVTLPLLKPSLAAAFGVGFVFSLNETILTIFLAGPNQETLPTIIWPQLRYSATPLVAVASNAMLSVAIVGGICVMRFTRNRI